MEVLSYTTGANLSEEDWQLLKKQTIKIIQTGFMKFDLMFATEMLLKLGII